MTANPAPAAHLAFRRVGGGNRGKTAKAGYIETPVLLQSRSFRRDAREALGFLDLPQRAAVLDGHHLDEAVADDRPVVEYLLGPARAGVEEVVGDQLVQPLGVVARHVGEHVDAAFELHVAAMVMESLHELVLLAHRLEVDHRKIAALGEGAVLVEHVSDAARHAGREIAPGLSDDHDDAAGHVLAAMVAGTLDDGDRAGVPDREALAGDAAEVALAGDRAVEHGVADDDRALRHDAGVRRRPHHDAPAGKTLADVVVGLALEIESDAGGEPGAEGLAGGAAQLDGDAAVGKPGMAVALRDLAREHRAGRPVDIRDALHEHDRPLALERRPRLVDQLAVEDFEDLVVLPLAAMD